VVPQDGWCLQNEKYADQANQRRERHFKKISFMHSLSQCINETFGPIPVDVRYSKCDVNGFWGLIQRAPLYNAPNGKLRNRQ